MQQNHFIQKLKYFFTTIACINLVFLFIFHYELPNFLKHKLNTVQNKNIKSSITERDSLTISFDEENITYHGEGNLNLTKGITVTNKNGVEVKASLFSEITEGSKKNEKIIQYVAEDTYGNTGTATRTLSLKNYQGPSIQLNQNLPSIDDTELQSLSKIFVDMNAVSAEDGYGNDISTSIETTYTLKDQSAQEIILSFHITNLFNDEATKSVTIPLHRTKPLIVLSNESIHLDLGASFLPISYLSSATDENGKDISSMIEIEGDVDTSIAGVYRITYKLKNSDGNSADPVSLKITVN